MKARFLVLLLLFLLIPLAVEHVQPVSAQDTEIVPNMLEIQRTPPGAGGGSANVAQPQLVHDIYHNILSLPRQAEHEVCPMYVTAQYKLTFSHGKSSVLNANVLQGGCLTVNLGHGDIRDATPAFWSLLQQADAPGGTHPAPHIPAGLGPKDLQSAYGLPAATKGKGQTIAIIDAFDDPDAEADLAVYRKTFGLPACTTANGCFKKVDEDGGKYYPAVDQNWAAEIALDLDLVSAICPRCHILFVEGKSASFPDLGRSINTAVRLHANVISNSYGSVEDAETARLAARYYEHPGVIITASAGDQGYGVQLPAAFKNVVAVGGTSLSRAKNARGWQEVVWSGTGSGCSQYINKPIWQKDSGCPRRSVADVAAVADPTTGVAVYNTCGATGWGVFGGTSASAPIIAGIFALAGNAAHVNSAYLYSHRAALNPVLSGSNGICTPDYLCSAVSGGYNGPTGLGTPKGINAF